MVRRRLQSMPVNRASKAIAPPPGGFISAKFALEGSSTADQNLRLHGATKPEILQHFLHSRRISVDLQDMVAEAQAAGDLILVQQGDRQRALNLKAPHGENTYSCFIGKKGNEEFFTLLKTAIAENHYLGKLMYDHTLVWDLRGAHSGETSSVQIYKRHGGRIEVYRLVLEKVPLLDAYRWKVSPERLISHTLVPKLVGGKMRRRSSERRQWNWSLQNLLRDSFFLPIAEGKGLAYYRHVKWGKLKCRIAIRGIPEAEALFPRLVNAIQNLPDIETVSEISVVLADGEIKTLIPLQGELFHKTSPGPLTILKETLRNTIHEKVMDFMTYVAFSDQHAGDGGELDDCNSVPGKMDRIVRGINHLGAKGHQFVLLGDIFELWKFSWSEVRDALANQPFFKALRQPGPVYFVMGNHDYQINKPEIIMDLKCLLHDVKLVLREVKPGQKGATYQVNLDDVDLYLDGKLISSDDLKIQTIGGKPVLNDPEFQQRLLVLPKLGRYIPRLSDRTSLAPLTFAGVVFGDRVRVTNALRVPHLGLYYAHMNIGDPYCFGWDMHRGFKNANLWLLQLATQITGISPHDVESWLVRFLTTFRFRIERKFLQQLIEVLRLSENYADYVQFLNNPASPIDLGSLQKTPFGLAPPSEPGGKPELHLFGGHTHDDSYIVEQNRMLKLMADQIGLPFVPVFHQTRSLVERVYFTNPMTAEGGISKGVRARPKKGAKEEERMVITRPQGGPGRVTNINLAEVYANEVEPKPAA